MGITVNNILPGSIQTQRLESLWRYQAEQTGVPLESILEQTLQQIPMRRIGQPEEIAALALFLASPLAGYITGVSIPLMAGARAACSRYGGNTTRIPSRLHRALTSNGPARTLRSAKRKGKALPAL